MKYQPPKERIKAREIIHRCISLVPSQIRSRRGGPELIDLYNERAGAYVPSIRY